MYPPVLGDFIIFGGHPQYPRQERAPAPLVKLALGHLDSRFRGNDMRTDCFASLAMT